MLVGKQLRTIPTQLTYPREKTWLSKAQERRPGKARPTLQVP